MIKEAFRKRHLHYAGAALAAVALAACTPSTAETGALVSINGALARVSCPTVAQGASSLGNAIVTVAVPNAAEAAAVQLGVLAGTSIFAAACPALVGLGQFGIQTVIDQSVQGTPVARVSLREIRSMNMRARRGLRHAPVCTKVMPGVMAYRCTMS